MKTYTEKTVENKSSLLPQNKKNVTVQFVDKQPETRAQRKIQIIAHKSPQILQLKAIQEIANNASRKTLLQKKENHTGLPDHLKLGIENLSGYSMDDVKVHYNSEKPAQLNAHAYAQGTDIHLSSGQEKHLPHEAWHVVQQKQGRVKPTVQMKGKVNINDDASLEKEADVIGAKLSSHQIDKNETELKAQHGFTKQLKSHFSGNNVAQLVIIAPPVNDLDVIGLMSIMQMIRNGIDDKIVGYNLIGSTDLTKEKKILFKGHGGANGTYAGGISGTAIGQLLKDKISRDVYIGLDFCYSSKMLESVSQELDKPHVIEGNRHTSVTQNDGYNYSKTVPLDYSEDQIDTQKIFSKKCNEIKLDSRWSEAEIMVGNLQKDLKKAKDMKEYTQIFIEQGTKIFEHIIDIYQSLYELNSVIINPEGRKIIADEETIRKTAQGIAEEYAMIYGWGSKSIKEFAQSSEARKLAKMRLGNRNKKRPSYIM